MITDEYKTINNVGKGTYSEKRSKFLAFSHHVETEDEVKEIVAEYRKKYYDARHVCYAYMLGADRSIFRANDDGEPSSTAGKPILGQINSNELTDILIIVVRYYGGYPREIATFLELPEPPLYTGHCFRKILMFESWIF